MNRRQEKMKVLRTRVGKLAKNVHELTTNQVRPDFSNLTDMELQLSISLMRKACGCPALANLSLLDLTEGELVSARHSGYDNLLTTLDQDRLMQPEQAMLSTLWEKVIWPDD